MNHLVSQALDHEFPAAPQFEAEVKSSNLKKVFEVVSQAAWSTDGRVPVDKVLRPLVRSIANPLKLGEMGLDATHFVLGQHWKNHFTKKVAETGSAVDVRQLRKWIDDPKPMGLPKEAEHLVILIYALQTNQTFFIHEGPFPQAALGNLPRCMYPSCGEASTPGANGMSRSNVRAAIFGVAPSPSPELEQRFVACRGSEEESQQMRGPPARATARSSATGQRSWALHLRSLTV